MQDAIVFLIVGGAVAHLVRHFWLTGTGKQGCGKCAAGGGGCSAKAQPAGPPALVQIDLNGSWKKDG